MTATTERIHASCMLVEESEIPAGMSIAEYRRVRRAATLAVNTSGTPFARLTSFAVVRRRTPGTRGLPRF